MLITEGVFTVKEMREEMLRDFNILVSKGYIREMVYE